MLESGREGIHSFFSEAREGIKINGVKDVISFDGDGVSLETSLGQMAVEGEGLKVRVLNTKDGIVEIDGKINGVYYFDEKPSVKRGLLGRKS